MLNIIGTIASTSGYAQHVRSLASALFKIMPTRLTTYIPQGFEREMTDAEVEMVQRKPEKDEINIIIDMCWNWKMHINGDNNIGFLVWEGDKIPLSFIGEILNPKIKQIWVPSLHTQNAVLNTAKDLDELNEIADKIRIVPHGVDLSMFYPVKKPDIFTFVCNKGFRNDYDRGGLQYAIDAYLQEFKKGEALLRLKINPAYGDYINTYLRKKVKPNSPDIFLDFNVYPHNKLREIYQGNVLVSPVRSEAYGLQMIEAMACGLPVITTNFGGQTDFVDTQNGWLIDYKLNPVKNELFYEEVNWAIPDLKALRQMMREAYDNHQMLENKSAKALETSQNNTWDKSAGIAKKWLDELK